MTPDNPSSIDSFPTMLDDNQPSGTLSQKEAEGLMTTVFQDGTSTIKRMIQLIRDEDGIDLEAAYRRESQREEDFRKRHRLPALNLPTWEEIAPTSPALDLITQMRLIPHIVHLNSDLRGSISRAGIRHDLALAQKDGFDPKDLYEKAVLSKHLKGDLKYPAPPYSEVDPNQPLR